MKHTELRNQNALILFKSVKKGNTTVEEIMKDTGFSHVTVKKLGKLLTDNRILKLYTLVKGKRGRPTYHFKLSNDVFSAFMLEDPYSYMLIAINAYSNVVFRHDYIKRLSFTFERNLHRAVRSVSARPDYLCCFNYFANCDEASNVLLPDYVEAVDLKELIVRSVCDPDIIVAVEFEDECFISMYGRIHKTDAKIKGILRVIKPDKIISYKKDILEGLFDALEKATIKKMEEKILLLE